jgi:hypothetical protein
VGAAGLLGIALALLLEAFAFAGRLAGMKHVTGFPFCQSVDGGRQYPTPSSSSSRSQSPHVNFSASLRRFGFLAVPLVTITVFPMFSPCPQSIRHARKKRNNYFVAHEA